MRCIWDITDSCVEWLSCWRGEAGTAAGRGRAAARRQHAYFPARPCHARCQGAALGLQGGISSGLGCPIQGGCKYQPKLNQIKLNW